VELRGTGLISCTIPSFAWRRWEKPQKLSWYPVDGPTSEPVTRKRSVNLSTVAFGFSVFSIWSVQLHHQWGHNSLPHIPPDSSFIINLHKATHVNFHGVSIWQGVVKQLTNCYRSCIITRLRTQTWSWNKRHEMSQAYTLQLRNLIVWSPGL
jgi:hypothetical protein